MKKTRVLSLTEGPILSSLIRFTLPILGALFLQAMYGAVDLAVVGHFAEKAEVSAVSTGSQIMTTVIEIVSAFAVGTTVLLGQKIGQRRSKEGGEVIGASLWLYLIITISLTLLFAFFSKTAARWMHAPAAALATVAAQGLSVLISVQLIRRQDLPFHFEVHMIRRRPALNRELLEIGFPIALQTLLVDLSFLIILAIVNAIGLTASSSIGIAEKACFFLMLIPIGFMQAISAFVAQNRGAGQFDRIFGALRQSVLIAAVSAAAMFALSYFHGDLLARIFTNDTAVIAGAADYLKAYGIDCLLTCFLFCFIGFFDGMARTRFVMIQGVASAFGVRVPVSYLMSKRQPVSLFHIGLAVPISTLFQMMLVLIYYAWLKRQIRQNPGAFL